jgi:hypothetical protein
MTIQGAGWRLFVFEMKTRFFNAEAAEMRRGGGTRRKNKA